MNSKKRKIARSAWQSPTFLLSFTSFCKVLQSLPKISLCFFMWGLENHEIKFMSWEFPQKQHEHCWPSEKTNISWGNSIVNFQVPEQDKLLHKSPDSPKKTQLCCAQYFYFSLVQMCWHNSQFFFSLWPSNKDRITFFYHFSDGKNFKK